MAKPVDLKYVKNFTSAIRVEYDEEWIPSDLDHEKFGEKCKIISSLDELFVKNVSLSVIEGHYIYGPAEIEDDLTTLLNTLQVDVILPTSPTSEQKLLYKRWKRQSRLFETVVKRYRYLCSLVDNRLDASYKSDIYNSLDEMTLRVFHSKPYGVFFDCLFIITRCDLFFVHDSKVVTELQLCRRRLQDVRPSESWKMVHKALLAKCEFLLKKLLINKDENVDVVVDYSYLRTGEKDLCPEGFDDFSKKYEFYMKESYSDGDLYGMELLKLSNTLGTRLAVYPLLMKFYKDTPNVTLQRIDNLFEQYLDCHTKVVDSMSKYSYQKYALDTIQNYMYNCRLSFRMKAVNYSLAKLKSDMTQILCLQRETKILNFYPYRKAVFYLLDQLESSVDNAHEDLDEMFVLLKEYIRQFENTLSWCRIKGFYPVQNLYSDCIVTVGDVENVYVASSYCRPIEYHWVRDELSECKARMMFLQNKAKNIAERKEIENLKDKFEKSVNKNVETMAIFSAIVAFLFGCVDFLSKAGEGTTISVHNLLFSVLAIGAVMLLFANTIFIWTMPRETSIREFFTNLRNWLFILSSLFYMFVFAKSIVNVEKYWNADGRIKQEKNVKQNNVREENVGVTSNAPNKTKGTGVNNPIMKTIIEQEKGK